MAPWKQPRVIWEASKLTQLVRSTGPYLGTHAVDTAAVLSARLLRSCVALEQIYKIASLYCGATKSGMCAVKDAQNRAQSSSNARRHRHKVFAL